jgi:hypothetical protein
MKCKRPSDSRILTSGRWRRAARIVLCAGLQSSGSTWLFHVVIGLISKHNKSVVPFFADSLDSFPEVPTDTDYLVVKNHAPHGSLLKLAALTEAPILMTIRDPRDSVSSLMTRFSYTFADAERVVAASAAALEQVGSRQANVLLRYEDAFFDDIQTVKKVASHLGLRVSQKVMQEVFNGLTPQMVRGKIAELQKKGIFGEGRDPARYDPKTLWHLGHIGTRKSGQFSTTLSPSQQISVAIATRGYCREFNYSLPLGGVDKFEPVTRDCDV